MGARDPIVGAITPQELFPDRQPPPLRETLMAQTGATEDERRTFLQDVDTWAIEHLVHRWAPTNEASPAF